MRTQSHEDRKRMSGQFPEDRIRKLEAENKALKETLGKTTDLVVDYQERMVKVEESRDDLLDFIEFARERWRENNLGGIERFDTVIQRANAPKEKETK